MARSQRGSQSEPANLFRNPDVEDTDTDLGPELEEIDINAISHRTLFPTASGAFGNIWRAQCKGVLVALKQLRPHQVPEKARKRFYQEAYIWSSLKRHRYVLPLIGVTRDAEGALYMIAPWMRNGHLNSFIKSNPDTNRLQLVIDIVRGLRYLHSNKVVHGDLRGDNILISDTGRARLSDFGLSLALDKLAISTHGTSLRDAGATRWMAPELFAMPSPGITMKSDVWSFSMVVIEIFTGEPPFADQIPNDWSIPDLVQQKNNRPKRPVDSEASQSMPDPLWDIIVQCWRKDPATRPTARIAASSIQKLRLCRTSDDLVSSIGSEDKAMRAEFVADDLRLLYDSPLDKVNLTGEVSRTGKFPFASGSYSTLWMGEWRPLSFPTSCSPLKVALKTLRGSTHATGKCLLREARVLSRLRHPNIVPLLGITFGEDPESPMYCSLVLPFYENGNVITFLNKTPGAERMQIVLDVAAGLAYLHSLHPAVIHGNLKCTNILVTSDGRACVCDFGLQVYDEEDDIDSDIPSMNTPPRSPLVSSVSSRGSGLMSSVRYTACEIIKEDDVKPNTWSDVWSFGCVACEIVYDQAPYAQYRRDDRASFAAQRGELPADLSQCDVFRPPADTTLASDSLTDTQLRSLIHHCWDPEPTRRPTMQRISSLLTGAASLEVPIQHSHIPPDCSDEPMRMTEEDEISEDDDRNDPSDSEYDIVHYNSGEDDDTSVSRAHPEEALEERVALDLRLYQFSPQAHRASLARSLYILCCELRSQRRFEEACTRGEQCATLYHECYQLDPKRYRADFASALFGLGLGLLSCRRPNDACIAFEECVLLHRELSPKAHSASLAESLFYLASQQRVLGRIEDAHATDQECVFIYCQIYEADPEVYRNRFADALFNLGVDLHSLGHDDDACMTLEVSASLRRQLHSAAPRIHRAPLANCLYNLGIILRSLGDYEASCRAKEECVALYRQLYNVDPEQYRARLASALNNLGGDLLSLSRYEDACTVDRECMALRRQLYELAPAEYEEALAQSLQNSAYTLTTAGRLEEAGIAYEQAVAFQRQRYNADPEAHRIDLASSLTDSGFHKYKTGSLEYACSAEREAVRLLRPLPRFGNVDTQAQISELRLLSKAQTLLGLALLACDRVDEGLAWCQLSVPISRDIYEAQPRKQDDVLAFTLVSFAMALVLNTRLEEARCLTIEVEDLMTRHNRTYEHFFDTEEGFSELRNCFGLTALQDKQRLVGNFAPTS